MHTNPAHTPEQKKAIESINSRLQLVMKSGKASLGYKETLKTLRSNKGEDVVHAHVCAIRASLVSLYGIIFDGNTLLDHHDGS
jgi:large subunit ribosomal protein L30e